jgi:hypothetical protein
MTLLDQEYVVDLGNGRQLRCPAYPEPCSYVRITQDGEEDCYWDWQEWSLDPQVVMGAILVSMRYMVTLTRTTD